MDFSPLTRDKILSPNSLHLVADWVEESLHKLFTNLAKKEHWQDDKPSLIDGARYSLLTGDISTKKASSGEARAKRLRPWFLFLSAVATGSDIKKFYHLALSIELIHGYSLIHDDLPAMDDDILRRGKSTLHLAFDKTLSTKDNEAFAILVGDLLQTLGFELLAHDEYLTVNEKNTLLLGLTRAIGFQGMVSGQWRDIIGARKIADVTKLKAEKTGALIEFSLQAAFLLAGDHITPTSQKLWGKMAHQTGLIYQALDDMMDEIATSEMMGKTTGKDKLAGKSTSITSLGMAKAKEEIIKWWQDIKISATAIKQTNHIDPQPLDQLLTWQATMIESIEIKD
ncbi:MAG: polyprenyl synthetase family protein [Alphaproteobacteria bacterium]